MARRKKKRKTEFKSQLTYELIGLGLLVIAVVTFARLGTVGEVFVRLFRFFFGEWFVLLAIGLLVVALFFMVKRKVPPFWTRRTAGLYIIAVAFSLLAHISLFNQLSGREGFEDQSVIRQTWRLYWLEMRGQAPNEDLGGGMIGAFSFAISHFLFAEAGTYLFGFVLIIVGIILLTGKSASNLLNKGFRAMYTFILDTFQSLAVELKRAWKAFTRRLKQEKEIYKERKKESKEGKESIQVQVENESPVLQDSEPEIVDFTQRAYQDHTGENKVEQRDHAIKDEALKTDEGKVSGELSGNLVTGEEVNKDYELPELEILKLPNNPSQLNEKKQLAANAKKLEQTLESFGVKAKVSKVHLGPAVTKYEVYPSVGVKVSRIVNLADDLALALAAKDIRMEAPIPGKSAIGIEVPNHEIAVVTLREVLDSTQSHQEENVLAVGLGRDISGNPVLAHLNKMPHLLVAGATGSGKSVCINGIIVSLLLKAKPHEVKLMMIDPKMVELNVYNGIPHLLTPVVTEPKKASQALKKVVAEMERRYDLFSHTGTRNIEGYNDLVRSQNEEGDAKQPTLPYIVVIVDELADLMMVASGDVEDSIARLAQMARASGIHMIIATQRPSVDVITGVIKANIPSRIAFGVSSQTDSRTILDSGGAEKLLGRGDMLYLPVGASKPTRIQGAFLSDQEVENVVQYVISQQKAQYEEEMIPNEEPIIEERATDELYDSAVELVVEMNTASVSMLQRRFRIGYTRAARIIDEMEARGVVGPYEGSKPREVLISKRNDNEATS
ncbi:DNA translocase FtsK [Bacillus sp. JCM 19034]|uniref:FtsK/SpoIIIE family DNA translocase n=1 Tax=Bacillus sp. JCM 19034 TaxID=1481928 RepID=UPI000783DCFC|nr:DNA translocase FtsK [Bacillus sp. JCM 19034]